MLSCEKIQTVASLNESNVSECICRYRETEMFDLVQIPLSVAEKRFPGKVYVPLASTHGLELNQAPQLLEFYIEQCRIRGF